MIHREIEALYHLPTEQVQQDALGLLEVRVMLKLLASENKAWLQVQTMDQCE